MRVIWDAPRLAAGFEVSPWGISAGDFAGLPTLARARDAPRAFYLGCHMATKYTPKTEYAKKLLDPRWQKLRLEVLNRDKFTCQCCGATDKTLHTHHTFYRDGAEGPWDYLPSDIVTVCFDCHEDEHAGWRERDAEIFRSLSMAGARTNAEMKELAGFAVELAEVIAFDDPDVRTRLFTGLDRYIERMQARSKQ